nr:MAG TPA: coiled-coil domain-containing protein [Caudoviricetes sp.]
MSVFLLIQLLYRYVQSVLRLFLTFRQFHSRLSPPILLS